MIRLVLLHTFFLCIVGLSTAMPVSTVERRGQVRTTDGLPLANVMVTDGYTVVLSNEEGQYRIIPSDRSTFIYITLPAGFQMPKRNNTHFFYPLAKEHVACSYDFVLESIGDDTNHAFIVMGDPQVYKEADVEGCRSFARDIKEYCDTAFRGLSVHGMITGDMVGDRFDLFAGVKHAFSEADVPFFYCKGNHDFALDGDLNTAAVYEAHFGPRYYAFNRGEIHYVVLDNVFHVAPAATYRGYIDEEQFRWLAQDLEQVPLGSTVVLMYHIPSVSKSFRKISPAQTVSNADDLYALLEGYKVHFLSGHTHLQDHFLLAPQLWEHNQASISGIFWQERNFCADGTPVGYSVYVAQGDSLSWKYKTLGWPDDMQCRAYAVGENPDHPEELTVLVWNYDPTWRVSWYEDGVYAGEMKQFVGHDPQTRNEIIKNKSKYAYDWIWTTPTDHLFSAKPISGKAELMIVVEDGFGNKYKTYVQ
ncbi:calcineurin-like phosphoesterase C-terminal domain-containing protein [Sphingobacterium sp. LRF_L2]|uniref:calcineurin-like phosphoesterase C-terminal domain-containing protein n=1 Tax=Sphingobacterium sp. LRF_L2 TaxID=3369421 RepID=UPI003F5E178A